MFVFALFFFIVFCLIDLSNLKFVLVCLSWSNWFAISTHPNPFSCEIQRLKYKNVEVSNVSEQLICNFSSSIEKLMTKSIQAIVPFWAFYLFLKWSISSTVLHSSQMILIVLEQLICNVNSAKPILPRKNWSAEILDDEFHPSVGKDDGAEARLHFQRNGHK